MRIDTRGYLAVAGLAGISLLGASSSLGKTFIIPHVLEKSGSISNTPFTFDTSIFYEDPNGPAGASSTVDTYIYDATGSPMTSATNTPVANPHSDTVIPKAARQVTLVQDMITASGGFSSPNELKLGFGVIVVSGADPEGVNLGGVLENSHENPSDLSVFGFDPQPISAPALKKTLVIPHVLETSGRIANTQNTFDTSLFMTYVGGLTGAGSAGTCDVSVTL
jgi:hypothetical protein